MQVIAVQTKHINTSQFVASWQKKVNDVGLLEIAAFLTTNTHHEPTLPDDRECLEAWALGAEYEMHEGRPPTISINSMLSINRCAQEYTISQDGVSVKQ